jgi:prepilin signal peptidase PulO-like enzyme (type II secretory pathway)
MVRPTNYQCDKYRQILITAVPHLAACLMHMVAMFNYSLLMLLLVMVLVVMLLVCMGMALQCQLGPAMLCLPHVLLITAPSQKYNTVKT